MLDLLDLVPAVVRPLDFTEEEKNYFFITKVKLEEVRVY